LRSIVFSCGTVISQIIERVNVIVEVAEKKSEQKLVVIVDGLDRHDYVTGA
jgi:hypothetical protein